MDTKKTFIVLYHSKMYQVGSQSVRENEVTFVVIVNVVEDTTVYMPLQQCLSHRGSKITDEANI